MKYYEGMKLAVLLPNQILFVIALFGMVCCLFLFWICRKICVTRTFNVIMDCVLVLLFTALYFVNTAIVREIAFLAPWDIMVVRSVAYKIANRIEIGYFYYLSTYSNNIPIAYILGRLLRKAGEMQAYASSAEFIWLQVTCVFVSLGGMFSCFTVKKITKKLMPTIVTFMLYIVLAGISPWKVAPYTDTYGIVFSIMCIYFYICSQKTERIILKYIYMILAMVSVTLGGIVKPSIYIILIALLIIEVMRLKENWRLVLTEVILAVSLLFAAGIYKNHLIQEIGMDFNPEIEASWQNYFYMGLNEETTGGYNSDDAGIFGEFQTSKNQRNKAALERAWERVKERGFWGTLNFWLNKMVMVFNDGTFGWGTEVWIEGEFPDDIASHTVWTQRLRDVFRPDGGNMGKYNTLCQLTWIFCILGIPGICICGKEKRREYGILVLSCLGIFLYQMLFEARARYLLVFLPFLISVSVCGMTQYYAAAVNLLGRRGIGQKQAL